MSDINDNANDEYDSVVEEITDDEETEEVANATPSATPDRASGESAPAVAAPPVAPGKVEPSTEVKALKMRAPGPETSANVPSGPAPLKPGKNPFEKRGDWTEAMFSQIAITVPTLGSGNETTNDLTRGNKPENRHWRDTIRFGFSGFISDTIRFDNVYIPYLSGPTYGSDYAYFRLPGFCVKMFADAGNTKGPTKVHENRVVPSSECWWKIGNNLEEKVGVAHGGKFLKKPLQTIFANSTMGLTVNLVARFNYKARTEDRSLLKSTTPRTISMEVVRAYIVQIGVDGDAPTKTQAAKKVEKTVATSKDVATDSLMEKLSSIGI